ncbi:hypothetical protein [Legionella shakespearei]|uniref:hypothetical protein n=1 Tax=Legionella shakespearei TaxID=45075 RepID=UPI00035FB5A5|nr:hypothetical protein [Legionella shakespearei]
MIFKPYCMKTLITLSLHQGYTYFKLILEPERHQSKSILTLTYCSLVVRNLIFYGDPMVHCMIKKTRAIHD